MKSFTGSDCLHPITVYSDPGSKTIWNFTLGIGQPYLATVVICGTRAVYTGQLMLEVPVTKASRTFCAVFSSA